MTRKALGPESVARIESLIAADGAAGIPIREIVARSGLHVCNVRMTVADLARELRAYTMHKPYKGAHELWVYADAGARDCALAEVKRGAAERRTAYYAERNKRRLAERAAEGRTKTARSQAAAQREAGKRAMRAAQAEIAKAAARGEREAKAAAKQRDQASAKSQRARLRAETAAAGALIFKTGTASPAVKKPAWADIPAFIPDGVEPVKLPNNLRDRFTVDEAPPCFSSLRYGEYIAPAPAWLQGVARP